MVKTKSRVYRHPAAFAPKAWTELSMNNYEAGWDTFDYRNDVIGPLEKAR